MGLFDTILKGGVGFLTGGWPGAALGLFSGEGSQGSSGMSQEQMDALGRGSTMAYGALSAPLGMGGMSPGYQQALYGLAGQMANQQGGMATMPGVPNNQMGMKWSRVNGKWQKVATGGAGGAQPTTMTAYTQALQEMLTGQGPWYQSQLAQGVGGINTQAVAGQQQMMGQLGRRGLLQSGVMTQGLGGIESGRLGAIGGLVGTLEQQRMQNQQFGMGQVAAQQELIMMARRAGISEEQIANAQSNQQWSQLASAIAAITGSGGSSGGGDTTSGGPYYSNADLPSGSIMYG